MADLNFVLRFDDGTCKVARILRGDTRSMSITVRGERSLVPIDLTGANVTVALPRDGGGSIKRRSFALTVTPRLVASTSPQALLVPNHGFVSGDMVSLTPSNGAILPRGLRSNVLYVVQVASNDVLSFDNLDMTPTAITDSGSGSFNIAQQDGCGVAEPLAGTIELFLSTDVTEALNQGQGQQVQVNIAYDDITRIVLAQNALDVTDQAYP